MKKVKYLVSIPALLVSCAALADVDFYGYMRGGVGVSGDSGQNIRYNQFRVGRLGNEDDIYAEIGLGKELYNQDDMSFYVDSMIALASDGSNDWEDANSDDANFALRQFNVQAKGIFDFAPEATLWAGKQYYQRHDVHITDFFYWSVSGAGAGLENIDLGDGKLSLAWVRGDSRGAEAGKGFEDELNINVLDARYAGINLWSDTTLEVGIDYAIVNDTDSQNAPSNVTKNGVLLTAELVMPEFVSGFNKTVFQFGTEGYGSTMATYGDGITYNVDAASGADGWRIINTGLVSPSMSWDFSHQLLYGMASGVDENQKDDISTFSAVVRPAYKWDQHTKTLLEVGYFKDTDSAGEKHSGQKYTLAQAWTAGENFFARPEIRVYASYVKDDEKVFANETSDDEVSFGVQAEAWW